jgi:hypothetical protein
MKFCVLPLFIATMIATPAPPTPALYASGSVEFTIDVDPGAPSATAWMAYLIARLSYVTKHPSEYPANAKGVVVATFPEELAGRITGVEMYQKLLKQGRIPHDAYWDDVVKVAYAGYLPEYVWTFFRKPSWNQAAAPKKLAQFSAWQKSNLPAHRPATYGGLEYGKSR